MSELDLWSFHALFSDYVQKCNRQCLTSVNGTVRQTFCRVMYTLVFLVFLVFLYSVLSFYLYVYFFIFIFIFDMDLVV